MILKFRAWDKTCKKMIYSGFAVRADGDIEGIDYTNTYAAKNFIVMQSTGLIDKNGVEMYEGDIVECQHTYNGIIKGKLVYCEAGACWGIEVFDEPTWYAWFCDDIEENENGEYDVKVIGNIYENPELLEEG